MKKIFKFLQDGWSVVMLAVLFSATLPMVREFGFMYLDVTTALSSSIFLLVLWYLFSTWNVERAGYLIASGMASMMGMILGIDIFLVTQEIITPETFAFLFQAGVLGGLGGITCGLFIEWVIKPWKNNEG
jgi:hypothetical protein